MYVKNYKIAEKIIEVNSMYKDVHALCAEYEFTGEPDFTVIITQADIDYERKKSAIEDTKEGLPVRNFADSYLETLAVYRKMAEKMVNYDTILFHGSAIAVDGKAYLFTAKSGTGKSTHTGLWRKLLGERAVMINDDKPLLKITQESVHVFGTPWDGKHRLSNNISVPLAGICILRRDEQNKIEQVDRFAAYPMFLQQTYRSGNQEVLVKTLRLLDELINKTKIYQLDCNMSIEAAQVAYEGMRG